MQTHYITTTQELEKYCQEIQQTSNIIALDTEFIRRYTYFPKLCLVQVCYYFNNQYKTLLIDPLSKELDLKSFTEILQNPNIKKVVHSAVQDIEAFYKSNGKIAKGIEDSQILASYSGFRARIGYSELIKNLFDIELDKGQQRSAWQKRPLTTAQRTYAADDVKYLLKTYSILTEKLEQKQNTKNYREELNKLYNQNFIQNMITNSWKRFKVFAKDKNKKGKYPKLIKALCIFREKHAIKIDSIRANVFNDDFIKFMAFHRPLTIKKAVKLYNIEKRYKPNLRLPRNQKIFKKTIRYVWYSFFNFF